MHYFPLRVEYIPIGLETMRYFHFVLIPTCNYHFQHGGLFRGASSLSPHFSRSLNAPNPGPERASLVTPGESQSHPSGGCNGGYSLKMRGEVISMWQNGVDLAAPWLVPLRAQHKFPSLATCNRWISQFQAEGEAAQEAFNIHKHDQPCKD
jgi:hypothetical protein